LKNLFLKNPGEMFASLRLIIAAISTITVPVTCSADSGKSGNNSEIHNLWLECRLDKSLSFDIFFAAIKGYGQTDGKRKKNIITIIDFSKPSTEERFFVIDMNARKLLYHCLVAHGKNSGGKYAESFSNEPGSLKSSLGFYLTAETCSGKHGYTLRLDGLEKNINDNARSREIVIHGADYVSQEFIDKYGRLGLSWGCPALPQKISKEIIDSISGGSCLFIYAKDVNYSANSTFLKVKN
jgi:hypothetical protein